MENEGVEEIKKSKDGRRKYNKYLYLIIFNVVR
jgi:hypothetical protein